MILPSTLSDRAPAGARATSKQSQCHLTVPIHYYSVAVIWLRNTDRLSARHFVRLSCVAVALAVAALAGTTQVLAQLASIRGFISDLTNGEALATVHVLLESSGGDLRGSVTDTDGIYSITRIPPGVYFLRASYVGYTGHQDTLRLGAGQRIALNLSLAPIASELDELVVEAEPESGAARVTAGQQVVTPRDIDLIPMPDISGDLASFLTALPGVVSLGDRGGQLFIRGGEPSHNLTLIDGMYVHQPSHILGFYSAFPSDIIRQADIYTAGYGGPYSGRIASVIDVKSRNGNKRQYDASVSVAPFVSAVQLEGPLVRNRVSIIGSARQSMIRQFAQHYVSQDLPYTFGDAFAKVHMIISPTSQLSVSGLFTHDSGAIGLPSEDRILEEVGWKNYAIGTRYVVMPRALPFVAEVLLSYSRLDTDQGPKGDPVRWSRSEGFSYAVNMTSFYQRAEWHWGLYWRAPQITSQLGGLYQDVEFGYSRRHKAGLYIEPDFFITPELRARITLIGELFPGQEDTNILEPRIRLVWEREQHAFSAAAGVYHQEIFGLNDRRDATNVFTAWRSAPTTDLSRAVHALAGYRFSPSPGLEFAVEGFYKTLSNLFIGEWTSFPRFTTRLQRADGRVIGVDFRAEVRHSRFYGYINYGLSSVEYEARQPSISLWFGQDRLRFRPPHDRRHQLNVVGNMKLGAYEVSARWNFGSGRPFNLVYGFDGFVNMDGYQDIFAVSDEQRVIYGPPYSGILPTYHRLDVNVERRFEVEGNSITAQVGAINLYDRRNLFALDLFTTRRSYQLPFVPTLSLKFSSR